MPRFAPHPDRRPTLITGASGGIGEAIARMLAAAGFPVVLAARRQERCVRIAAEINEQGGEAHALPLDLADPESIRQLCIEAVAAVGPIEVLVSNAGDVDPFIAVEATPERFARQLAVNLAGAQHLCHLLVPPMIGRTRGEVVFVTSDSAVNPRTHMAGYVAAKAGLEGLATVLAAESEGTGVRVGMVRPGPASTEQGSGWELAALKRAVESWRERGFLRHDGTLRPAQVASAVLAMIQVPRGARFSLIEVQPEAPVIDRERLHLPELGELDDELTGPAASTDRSASTDKISTTQEKAT
jgi:NAD(P)-dependent dehydrogenase (short-subunit alcohol dehydrogenase family)